MSKHHLPAVLLIVVLGFAVYGNSIDGKFLWDDEHLIQTNAYVRSFNYLPQVFTQDIGAGSGRVYGFYRPLQMATYCLDYALWGLNETGYHLTSITLHILAALALYSLVAVLFGKALIAIVTSILFLVHPVNVGVVAYISGRADSLALLFMVITLLLYVKNSKKERPVLHVGVVLAYTLALLSKEVSLILPMLVLVYHVAFKERLVPKVYLPVIVTALAYAIIRWTVLKDTIVVAPGELQGTLLQRLPGCFVALFTYVRLLVVPFDLRMEYGAPLFAFSDWHAWAGVTVFGLLLVAAIRKRGNRLILFALLWFTVGILPVSNLVPLNAYMAEHWLYLPGIGIFLLVAAGICRLYRTPAFGGAAIAVVLLLTMAYAMLTIEQNRYWEAPIPFFERTLKFAPNSKRVLNDLARLYEAKGMVKEAAELYERAIVVDPGFALPYNNLGVLYHNLGDDAKAMPLYEMAIKLRPDYADALNNLAGVYDGMQRLDEAIAFYKKALEANPNLAGAYSNLGSSYMKLGKRDEAIEAYNRAIAIDPGFAYAQYNLAVLYYNAREPDLAIPYLDRAIALGFKADPRVVEDLSRFRR